MVTNGPRHAAGKGVSRLKSMGILGYPDVSEVSGTAGANLVTVHRPLGRDENIGNSLAEGPKANKTEIPREGSPSDRTPSFMILKRFGIDMGKCETQANDVDRHREEILEFY